MSMGQLIDDSSGREYSLGFEVMTIGRHGDNAITLTDPQASRHHAEISRQGGQWVVHDLDSGNGTFVNGQRIDEPCVLRHGDLLRVGQSSFRVELSAALSREDTLVERFPSQTPAPTAPPRLWGRWVPALAALVILAAVVAAAALAWRAWRPQGREEAPASAPTSPPGSAIASGPATVVIVGEAPTSANAVRARATATALPTVPPSTLPAPPALPPTAAFPTTQPVGPAPVIGFFRASPSTLVPGQCTRLEWGEVQNANRLALSGVGTVAPSGKLDVCLDATKVYTIRATGPGGSTEERVEVTVNPPEAPLIQYFRVVPSIVRPGDCAQLEWGKVDNAITASIEPEIGGVGTPGSVQVCPIETTTYVLTTQNQQAGSTARAMLIVSTEDAPAPVIAFFTANPAQIQAGECTVLSWGKVDYATSVTIDHGIGGVATPGSIEVCLGSTTSYVMTALGSGGTAEMSLPITVSPGQLADLPDLVAESILFEPNPCYRLQKCKVRIKVRNDGTLAAGHFVLRWAPEGREAVPVEWDLLGLAAGEEKVVEYTWIPSQAREGWPTGATVDHYREVEELDEGVTNHLEQTITVLDPYPDG